LVCWLSGYRAQTGYVACDVIRCLGEAAAPGGICGPCPDFVLNTLAFALQLRKTPENISQCNGMALGCLASNAIRLSTWPPRAVASTGLLSPAALGFHVRRQGSALGKLEYLQRCRTRGFPTSANFESKLSVRALKWSANSRTHRSS